MNNLLKKSPFKLLQLLNDFMSSTFLISFIFFLNFCINLSYAKITDSINYLYDTASGGHEAGEVSSSTLSYDQKNIPIYGYEKFSYYIYSQLLRDIFLTPYPCFNTNNLCYICGIDDSTPKNRDKYYNNKKQCTWGKDGKESEFF